MKTLIDSLMSDEVLYKFVLFNTAPNFVAFRRQGIRCTGFGFPLG